ncbi:MAG: RNB domain-containing ribonuclease [Bacteroidota bacterium]|nr:RNB domain-containing ribonuclease [Bacteroidota bacterium]MDP4212719.1 RNB domain-containing ribonuclease [Bacteroidota bacterium]MDP4250537.1 RNB domain-containing ribonuclease [Bacteroidota bacterium]
MSNSNDNRQRSILKSIARRAMTDRGLLPDFSADAISELNGIREVPATITGSVRDLRKLAWCSIDNDDSRDLDQLSVAIPMPADMTKILVAVADVDAVVKKGTALDGHAKQNTTSVYTAAIIFPMLPEKLSTGITSLNADADRYAIVVEMSIDKDGSLQASDIYQAVVRNQAKLAYNSLAAWLDGTGPMPQPISPISGLDRNIRLQYQVAQKLSTRRFANGALNFETIEARPVFDGDNISDLKAEKSNSAKHIIEEFMISANGVVARWLASRQFPSMRRVVRTPKRWDRIVELAAEKNYDLPQQADSRALDQFLLAEKKADPDRFPDLSLSIIKLLGSGEYVIEFPGEQASGHFGLAVKDYTHSTAPNRRFPDLVTQRLLKAALANGAVPYAQDELLGLAAHCTEQEDDAKKVERQVEKSAAAMLLQNKIGQQFDAIVTGASDKGVWVRLFQMPVEGKLVSGSEGLDVGHRLRVQLVSTDVNRGFIDFRRVK